MRSESPLFWRLTEKDLPNPIPLGHRLHVMVSGYTFWRRYAWGVSYYYDDEKRTVAELVRDAVQHTSKIERLFWRIRTDVHIEEFRNHKII